MALETYDELMGFVIDMIGRRSLEERVSNWLWIAELEAQRELDLEQTEKSVDGTTDADKGYIQLPGDYVGLRHVKIKTDPVRWIRMSVPVEATVVESSIRMAENPVMGFISNARLYYQRAEVDVDYTLIYYAGIEHLGASCQTNWLLRVGADYLAYTALVHSASFSGDQRVSAWIPLQQRAEESMRRQAFRTRTGGGPLHMRSDWGHP